MTTKISLASILGLALLPSVANAGFSRFPPVLVTQLNVSYPVPSANCREVRAAYSQLGTEFLVEDATICWDPAYPQAATSETLTVWAPDVGSYSYTVDRFAHPANDATVTERFTGANGIAAAPRTGLYYIPTQRVPFWADADINSRFAAPLAKAAALASEVDGYHAGHQSTPIAIRAASTLMLPWVDMLDFKGGEPAGYTGGNGSGANGGYPVLHCFETADGSDCTEQDPHINDL